METGEVIEAAPWTRLVEILSLQTAAKLFGLDTINVRRSHGTFDIYSRSTRKTPECPQIVFFRDADLIPHPAWKICCENRYYIEDLGHSVKGTLHGVSCWSEYAGTYSVQHPGPLRFVKKSDAPYFLLGGDENHYHWIVNYLPRLVLLKHLREIQPRLETVNLVVPSTLSKNATEILQFLDIGPYSLFPLDNTCVWKFEELIVPSFTPTSELSTEGLQGLKSLYNRATGSTPKRRILIGRSDSTTGYPRRRVQNENEVLKACSKYGFRLYHLANMPVRDQLQLFSEADMVIGPHGAGFANLVFSPNRTKAIIFENSWNHTFMLDMAKASGCSAVTLLCEDVVDPEFELKYTQNGILDQEVRRCRDMTVSTERLCELIEAFPV